jgi:hypothetical protein
MRFVALRSGLIPGAPPRTPGYLGPEEVAEVVHVRAVWFARVTESTSEGVMHGIG